MLSKVATAFRILTNDGGGLQVPHTSANTSDESQTVGVESCGFHDYFWCLSSTPSALSQALGN